MKRNEHTFQFTGNQIAQAAEREHEYRLGRLAWWKAEHEKAIEQATSACTEIREHDVTGGKRVEVIIDPSVTKRLTECTNKILDHTSAADKLQIEAAVYRSQGDRVYELHPDDVIYFRLVGGPRVE